MQKIIKLIKHMKKLKIGIIGFGKHGSHYVRRYLETSDCKDIELLAIAENNSARLAYAKEYLENVVLFSDAIEMLDSGLIDACQIVVPHFEHFKYIEECFKKVCLKLLTNKEERFFIATSK